MKALPIDDHNQGIFFHKLGHFFPIFEKEQGRLPPLPPSSYAPDIYICIWNVMIYIYHIYMKWIENVPICICTMRYAHAYNYELYVRSKKETIILGIWSIYWLLPSTYLNQPSLIYKLKIKQFSMLRSRGIWQHWVESSV